MCEGVCVCWGGVGNGVPGLEVGIQSVASTYTVLLTISGYLYGPYIRSLERQCDNFRIVEMPLRVPWWTQGKLTSFKFNTAWGWWTILRCIAFTHGDVIKWKRFLRGIHLSPVNSPHKGQWHRALMFPSVCAWISGWVNRREAGDLKRHRTHYHVIVMRQKLCKSVTVNSLRTSDAYMRQ